MKDSNATGNKRASRGLQILVLGIFGAAVAYGGVYFFGTAHSRRLLRSSQPELAWVKEEYHLSEAQFAAFRQLHNAYLPHREKRCREITRLNLQFERAVADASDLTPRIKRLLVQRAELRAKCQTEMLEHLFVASRTLPPGEARYYLVWMWRHTCLHETAATGHAWPMELKHGS